MAKRLIFSLTALSAAIAADAASAETLSDVLRRVYDSNPTIRAERARQDATAEAPKQAWAGALPQISGQAAYTKVEDTQTVNSTIFGQGATNTFNLDTRQYAVSAEQPIFTGLRNFNAIKQARARVRAGDAQLTGVEQDVLLQAATAYFDVLRDMEVFTANESNVAVLMKQQREAQVRFDYGEVTQTDVRQADARLAGAQAQLSTARAQLAVSRARFREIVGDMPGDLADNPPLPPLPDSESEAQAFAREAAPPNIAVREQEEASRRQVRIEEGSFLPTVSLTTSYLYAEEPSSFIEQNEQFAYGVRADIPIFQGGLRFSRRREAKALNARDRARIMEIERQVEAQVTGAWEQLTESRMRIAAARTQVDANQLALTGVRREAQVGTRTTLDVLNAEQELLNSQVSLASAQRDEQVASYALLAAMGALSVDLAIAAAAIERGDAPAIAATETIDYGDGPAPELTPARRDDQ